MRLIDADALKRKMQKVATEAWKMKLNAPIEKTFNQCIDYINSAPTIEPQQKGSKRLLKGKTEPQTEETEIERLERIDNEIEDAWARIRELTDEPQTDCQRK